MNNTQFRRLLLETPTAARGNEQSMNGVPSRGGATPSALGSRARSSMPMTPRTVAGSSGTDFARQLAERNAELNPSKSKKFKSSAAPKGTKLGAGYQDRTQLRSSGEEDQKATRIKALEDMVKLGQMDQTTFEALRDEIVGGDVRDVHLVKGLDFKLLDRVRRGEDVLAEGGKSEDPQERLGKPETDVDDEFEKLEEKSVQPLAKEEKLKKGEMAPPPSVAGKKRTRDDILKELRASRLAAAAEAKKPQPSLGPRFSKVGEKRESSRIERDERGREVLITVDADGNVKRKVKKAKIEKHGTVSKSLPMPDKDIAPLGMDVVAASPPPPEEIDDGDIFEGIGADYDPLGGIEDEPDSADEGTTGTSTHIDKITSTSQTSPPTSPPEDKTPPIPPIAPPIPATKGNYFNDSTSDNANPHINPLTDPATLAALIKKASTINPLSTTSSSAVDNEEEEEEAAKIARRKRMLDSHDRDADDMDAGFGGGRFDDEDDEGEGEKVRLSVWGEEGEDGGEGKGKGKGKRKRGGKKRKGDVDSAADVLRVMERRKGEGK